MAPPIDFQARSTIRTLTVAGAAIVAIFTGPFLSEAAASCGSRPGTPNRVGVTRITDSSARLYWTNTASEAVWYDIALTRRGEPIPGQTGIHGVGRQIRGWEVQQSIKGLTPGTKYCFQVRARTEPGSKGCVSLQWSSRVCFTTLKITPPLFTPDDVKKSKSRPSPTPKLH
ncbi:MAG: fibronectin type III domain-containing protein [Bradyrhizobium sp.]|uniref:fibronectin type III domain-containing protein n=1 Tax=Bradyrhizobium sp. TaxID=376 RepID=UPI003D1132AC